MTEGGVRAETAEACGGGLRERKKAHTRQALLLAALDLAESGGATSVTVEAIAEHAGVSPRTFFNYFASKEDAFLGVDPDEPTRLAQSLLARPESESLPEALQAVLIEHFRQLSEDVDGWRRRRSLVQESPALMASWWGANNRLSQALVDAALARSGVDVREDLSPIVAAYSAMGAVRAAIRQHATRGFEGEFKDCLHAGFRALEN